MKFTKTYHVKLFYEGFLHSYSQIFFSKSHFFAYLIILASFINIRLGFYGFLGVWITNGLAYLFGFNHHNLREGLYGLNSLLVVMALPAMFATNEQFWLICLIACLLTLFISVASMGVAARFGLPVLSLPFLLALWIILLAVRDYDALTASEGNIYILNDLYALGNQFGEDWGIRLVRWYHIITNLPISDLVIAYFKSLGAIIFQDNIVTGFILAIGILIYSRIAFTLTWLSFLVGYLFYYWFQGDVTHIHYSYIGFNFILSSIAIGGFFFVPSWRTYLLVVIITPIIALLIGASVTLLSPMGLPIYSFPFIIIVLLLLYVMNFSGRIHAFKKVIHQYYSPEKNLYHHLNERERFSKTTHYSVGLPYFGAWTISQGHNGKITHKGDWKYAWDFVIKDKDGHTYQHPGMLPEHYYCYNLPVLAPVSGYVVAIQDKVEDNAIGQINLEQNWGNSIVIKVGEGFYAQLSHLRQHTFKTYVGAYVRKGDILAYLGNSGRSPEPHIHFQLQTTPYIGSKTLYYPISQYMLKTKEGYTLKSYEIPQEDDTIEMIKPTSLLQKAYSFIPGKKLKFEIKEKNVTRIANWEVFTNSLNQTYIYCWTTKSYAYFVNTKELFYFTSFEGDRKSLLYYFYLGSYKVLLGFYKNLTIKDQLPLHQFSSGIKMYWQDFIAPFFILVRHQYQIKYDFIDDVVLTRQIKLHTSIKKHRLGLKRQLFDFSIECTNNQIDNFTIQKGKQIITAKQVFITHFE